MPAYKFAIPGVAAIVMAEDDEAVIEKVFGHLNNAREQFTDQEKEPHWIANGGTPCRDEGCQKSS